MTLIKPPTKQPPTLEFASWKTAAHQRYQTSAGEFVPGVTTVLNLLNKPQLVAWANNLGLQGIDNRKYLDEAAQVGGLGHYLIECAIKEMSPEEHIPDYSQNQIERASHAVSAWQTWCEQFRSVETVESEVQLVSDEHRFGGTIDWLVKINGILTLVDFKTSAAVYRDHRIQACAYWKLLQENGYRIGGLQIIHVPRGPGEVVDPTPMSGGQVLAGWRIFRSLLDIYWTIREHKDFK